MSIQLHDLISGNMVFGQNNASCRAQQQAVLFRFALVVLLTLFLERLFSDLLL
jgi:hypothetical protein